MTKQLSTMNDIQAQIDRSGLFFAHCEGDGVIHAIPRGTAPEGTGYREGFRVKVGVRGGLSLWLDRYGMDVSKADPVTGRDARRCLAINLRSHLALANVKD